MAGQICPNCGNEVPGELGSHAENLMTGLVQCPHCGEQVSLREPDAEPATGETATAEAAPPGRHESAESFSGNETVDELTEELGEKPT